MANLAPNQAKKKVTGQRRRLAYILGAILGLLILVAGVVYTISPPGWVPHLDNSYDTVTKSSLKNAINAEQLYFANHQSYKSCFGCSSTDLPGYYSDPNIRMNAESDKDGFILIATHEACHGGQWIYQSATEELKNSRPYEGCK